MKSLYLLPVLFLSACSTTPKLALQPQQPPVTATDSLRYPEMLRAYHFGRYVDPNDNLVMHEQHVVYRVEENARWSLRASPNGCVSASASVVPRDAAFNPLPVNEAMIAEVNAQKLATLQILMQTRTLSAALTQFQTSLAQTKTNLQETAKLWIAVEVIKHRLNALETAPPPSLADPISTTNESSDSLSP